MKYFKDLPTELQQAATRFKTKSMGNLARIIKQEGLNHFEESWDNQGFTDSSIQRWKARKAPARQFNKNGTRSKAYTRWQDKNTGRAILVSHRADTDGGHLKDAGRAEIRNNNNIVFIWDKVYAQVHNEGGRAGRGAGFMMPKRQFAGRSQALDKKVQQKFDKEMDNFFKNL